MTKRKLVSAGGWRRALDCPRCGTACWAIPANQPNSEYKHPWWADGETGTCGCGARLVVRADGERAELVRAAPARLDPELEAAVASSVREWAPVPPHEAEAMLLELDRLRVIEAAASTVVQAFRDAADEPDRSDAAWLSAFDKVDALSAIIRGEQ